MKKIFEVCPVLRKEPLNLIGYIKHELVFAVMFLPEIRFGGGSHLVWCPAS
jgi:hypothetical protein